MVKVLRTMDYIPILTMDVCLDHQDLFHMIKFPPSLTFVIAFDKAFVPELLIHIALLALNSPNVTKLCPARALFTLKVMVVK